MSADVIAMQDPHPNALTTMASANTNQRLPLRRAVYIHVSDLTNAYNIDHAKLEQELTRVKSEQENPSDESSHGVPLELDTSVKKRLQPPRGGSNMVVLVGKVRLVVDKKRVDGSRVRLAEVEMGDETGTVSLRARDQQIDTLEDISSKSGAVVLRNCTLELYQGKHIRLAVTKWGKLSTYPDMVPSTPAPPSKINRDRNFSMIDLSLVASAMVPTNTLQHHADRSDSYHQDPEPSRASSTPGGNRNYQSNQTRRGQRNARQSPGPAAGAQILQYDTAPVQQGMRQYQALPHGYATSGRYIDSMSVPQQQHYYQQEASAHHGSQQQQHQQQHIMLQHQYEMQQRQMQHMYHRQQDAPQRGHQQRQQPSSPMLVPATVPIATFENSFAGANEMQIPASPIPHRASNQFSSQQSQMISNAGQRQYHHQQHQQHLQQHSSAQNNVQRSQSPAYMNPQAATFDPATGNQQQQHQH